MSSPSSQASVSSSRRNALRAQLLEMDWALDTGPPQCPFTSEAVDNSLKRSASSPSMDYLLPDTLKAAPAVFSPRMTRSNSNKKAKLVNNCSMDLDGQVTLGKFFVVIDTNDPMEVMCGAPIEAKRFCAKTIKCKTKNHVDSKPHHNIKKAVYFLEKNNRTNKVALSDPIGSVEVFKTHFETLKDVDIGDPNYWIWVGAKLHVDSTQEEVKTVLMGPPVGHDNIQAGLTLCSDPEEEDTNEDTDLQRVSSPYRGRGSFKIHKSDDGLEIVRFGQRPRNDKMMDLPSNRPDSLKKANYAARHSPKQAALQSMMWEANMRKIYDITNVERPDPDQVGDFIIDGYQGVRWLVLAVDDTWDVLDAYGSEIKSLNGKVESLVNKIEHVQNDIREHVSFVSNPNGPSTHLLIQRLMDKVKKLEDSIKSLKVKTNILGVEAGKQHRKVNSIENDVNTHGELILKMHKQVLKLMDLYNQVAAQIDECPAGQAKEDIYPSHHHE